MPEITSVETIRAKLREFEERVDGAIIAATTLARIQRDTENLLANLQRISTNSEQSFLKAESVRLQLQKLQSEWEALKQQVDVSQAESKGMRDLLLSELTAAIQSLATKLTEAEVRLKATNTASLGEQADLLKRLDASTKTNADAVASAKALVAERAESLNQLLSTIRDELQSETRTKLTEIERHFQEKLQSTTSALTETAANNEQALREQMNSFQEEMKRDLAAHQRAMDSQLTDFLNRQNALVQNLSLQIDSFNRVAQTQSADLVATNTKLSELSTAFNAYKETATSEATVMATGVSALRTLLMSVQTTVDSQGKSITAFDLLLQTTATRLDQTLDKLRQIPLVGGKFK